MKYIKYLDENDFKKKERALSKYFRKQYKYWVFEVLPKLKQSGKIDGVYEIEFEIDELFKKVYGPMKLKFSVYNDIAILEDILPNDILIACFMKDLPVCKGIPYETKKDLLKIKILGDE